MRNLGSNLNSAAFFAILGLIASASPVLADSIVVNGGFEDQGFTTDPITGFTKYGNINGLTLGTGIAHSGDVAFEFNNAAPIGYISQALPTTPGTDYLLSFFFKSSDVSGYPAGAIEDQFVVNVGGDASTGLLIGGTTLFDQTNLPASMAPANDPYNFPLSYQQYNFDFIANSASTNLIFGGFNNPSTNFLDDVSVTAVPEPSSLAIIAGALAVFGVFWRRRSKSGSPTA